VVIPLIVVLLIWAAGWADFSIQIQIGSVIASGIIIAFLRAGLIVFAEELIFRGYFYRIFDLRYGIRIAIVISSVLWASSHLPDMVSSGLSTISILIGVLTFTLWGIFLA
jgi:membrane protease YdiL (CAAX protease family)